MRFTSLKLENTYDDHVTNTIVYKDYVHKTVDYEGYVTSTVVS